MNDTYKLFEVKNFSKTLEKHAGRIDNLNERMQELGIDYYDILGSDAWQAIDSQAEQKVHMWGDMPTQRRIARIINEMTRRAIQGSFEFYEIPKSYDTAFFMAHYMKVIEGMADVLEGINYRRGNV